MSVENAPVIVLAATSVERRLFPELPGTVCVQTGMGAALSAAAFQRALARPVSGAISFGFAGALVADLRCGTVLLPRAVRLADGRRVEVDGAWHLRVFEALNEAGSAPDVRDITQVDGVLGNGAHKASAARRSLAAAADMESGVLAEQAATSGIPMLVLRVVLDELADPLPAALGCAVSDQGALAPWRLLRGLLRGPGAFGPLLRLALRRRVAARSLARAAALTGCLRPPTRPPARYPEMAE
jgi:nucleoside phosphorylase